MNIGDFEMDHLTDELLLIELRRPSTDDEEARERLLERQQELWSQRIDEWRGRVSRVLGDDR